ncbi:MAG: O-antigen ligase family protein [Acidobacteria bacterium]|nr:O-antigen ligase family protein [Acidobacteriota bacterium]
MTARQKTDRKRPRLQRLEVCLGLFFGAFFTCLPFIFSSVGLEKFRVPKDIFVAISGVLLIAALLVFARLEIHLRPRFWEWALASSLVYAVGHTLWQQGTAGSLRALIQPLYFAVLLIVLAAAIPEELHQRLWVWIGAAAGLNSVLTLLQFYGRFPLMTRPTGEALQGRLNPAGLIGEVNSGGFLFALACLMLLHGVVAGRRSRLKALCAVLFCINLAGLAFTATLTAILALLPCLGIWLVFHHWWLFRRGGRISAPLLIFWAGLVLGIATATGLILQSELKGRIQKVWSQVRQGDWVEATTGRQPVYRITWAMIKERPWTGRGFNTFGQDFFYYRSETPFGQSVKLLDQPGSFQEAHNEYLQVWEEMGLPGLLFFLVILFGPIFGALPLLVRADDPGRSYWVGMLSIGMIFVAISCVSFFPFHLSVTGAYIVLLMAGLRQPRVQDRIQVRGAGRPALWKMAVFPALALWMASVQIRKWSANNEMGEAATLLESAVRPELPDWQKHILATSARYQLDRAEKMYPAFEEIDNLQGSALVLTGRPEEALLRYRKAATSVPSPEVLTNMAAAYLTLNDFDRARPLLETALRYNPNFPRAREAMAYLKSQQP